MRKISTILLKANVLYLRKFKSECGTPHVYEGKRWYLPLSSLKTSTDTNPFNILLDRLLYLILLNDNNVAQERRDGLEKLVE